MRKARPKPSWVKRLAEKRILRLLNLAKDKVISRPGLSKRYISLAIQISKRYNVSIPAEKKRHICRKCGVYLIEGHNLRVRAFSKQKNILYTCLECGNIKRKPYKPKVFIKEQTKRITH